MTSEGYVQAAKARRDEQKALFRGGVDMGLAKKLLEYSQTNRIVQAKLAKTGMKLRLVGVRMGWSWCGDIVDMVEQYQLTMGQLKNAREQFVEVLKSKVAEIEKERKDGI